MADPRQATPSDYTAVIQLLDLSFGFPDGHFRRTYGVLWHEDRVDWAQTYVMADGRDLLAVVRVNSLDLVLDGAAVRAGGIGSVATHPEARGRGHMGRLLEHAIREMTASGYHLSLLWGDRHRYESFGYETVGRTLSLDITDRGLARVGIEPLDLNVYDGESDALEAMLRAYARHPCRVGRTAEAAAMLLAPPDLRMLWAGAEPDLFGYMIVHLVGDEREVIREFGGNPDTVLGMARHRITSGAARRYAFPFPGGWAVPPSFRKVASGYHVNSTCMARILDLDRTVRVLLNQNRQPVRGSLTNLGELEPGEQAARLFGGVDAGPFCLFVWPLDTV